MWFSKPKKSKAADKWHTKAMLVDPKKTRITILWGEAPEICEGEENSWTESSNVGAENPNVIDAPKVCIPVETFEAVDPNPEIGEHNLETNFPNLEPIEADLTENQVSDLAEDTLEILVPNLEMKAPNLAETARGKETAEDSEVFEPKLQDITLEVAEAENAWEDAEDAEAWEENLDNIELKSPEESKAIAPIEDLAVADPNGIENVNSLEVGDSTCGFMFAEEEPLNVKFLRALEKTRSKWCYDKKFAKIVQKMEKGKKLKRSEFDKVYLHIRTYCQYN